MPKSTQPLQDQLFGSSTNSTPGMADQTTQVADKLGANKSTNAIPNEVRLPPKLPIQTLPQPSTDTLLSQNPSILSSAGAIGKHFNPDGALGSIPQAVGGPFDKDGAIGSQFDAGKDGIAGTVERAVDGPTNPAGSGGKV